MPGEVGSIDRKIWQWGQNYYHIFQCTETVMKRMGHQKKASKNTWRVRSHRSPNKTILWILHNGDHLVNMGKAIIRVV